MGRLEMEKTMTEIQALCRQYHHKNITLPEFKQRLRELLLGMTEATADIVAVRLLLPL